MVGLIVRQQFDIVNNKSQIVNIVSSKQFFVVKLKRYRLYFNLP